MDTKVKDNWPQILLITCVWTRIRVAVLFIEASKKKPLLHGGEGWLKQGLTL